MKKKNIIVEGISDKNIIQEIFKKESSFKDIGICYACGVKNIQNITPFLDLASREYVILSDADKPAKDRQKVFRNKNIWFTYQDLGFQYVTIEDFLIDKFIKDTMQEIELLKDLDYKIEEYDKIGKLKIYLYQNKKDLKIDDDKINNVIDDLKNLLFDRYDKKYLKKDKLLEVLKAIVEKLTDNNDDE